MPRKTKDPEVARIAAEAAAVKPAGQAQASGPRMRSVEDIVADHKANDALCRKLFVKPAKGER